MNERIEELKNQATDEIMGLRIVNHHRFAEFIVARCCSIADAWVINEDNGKNYPSERIKEYFGVKE